MSRRTLVSAVAFLAVPSCTVVSADTQRSCEPVSALVFFDRSISTEANQAYPAIAEQVEQQIDPLLRCPEAEVRAFAVHAVTRGGALRVEAVDTFSALTRPAGLSQLEWAQDSARIQERRDSVVKATRESLLRLATTDTAVLQKNWTDLLGTLELARKFLSRASAGQRKAIYYFSDMHESMPAPRRDFDAHPPLNRDEAEQWAREDAELIRHDMLVSDTTLKGVKVYVFSSPWKYSQQAPYIEAYWRRIFELVGADRDSIEYDQ